MLTYPVADVLRERSIPLLFSTGYGSGGLEEAYTGTPTPQWPFNRRLWTMQFMMRLARIDDGLLPRKETWDPVNRPHGPAFNDRGGIMRDHAVFLPPR